VVTGHIVVFHSVPVDTVEDCETDLAPVRLWSGAASEGPGVLAPGDPLGLPVLPGEGPAVPRDLAASPEVGSSV